MLVAPCGGFVYLETTLQNLTAILDKLAFTTPSTCSALSKSHESLASVVLDNRLILDYLLGEQGTLCTVINRTCCTYIDTTGQVEDTSENYMTKPKGSIK